MKGKGISMKKIFSGVLVLKIRELMWFTLFLFLPLAARAGINGGSVEISPFIGYNFFQSSQNLNNNLLYGGRISYNLTKIFALEGTLEFDNTTVHDNTITGNQEGQFRYPTNNVDIFFYNIDAVFNLMPDSDFTFFILGGFGDVNYNPSIENEDMTTFDLGVGAKYWLSDNFGLRVDVRDNMVTELFYENALFKNDYQNINTTLGLIFAFGGEPKKKEAVREDPPEVIYVAEEPKVEEKLAVIAAPPVVEKTIVLAFEDVHFSYDKSTLSDSAKAAIKTTILTLKINPKAHIRIAGYTSAAGTDEYNHDLSVRRAKAVADYLIQEGLISKDRLSTIGYGDTRPDMQEAAPGHHYSTAAKANMRVLFEVVVQ
jgi:OOP family OmpA-OmpF porin